MIRTCFGKNFLLPWLSIGAVHASKAVVGGAPTCCAATSVALCTRAGATEEVQHNIMNQTGSSVELGGGAINEKERRLDRVATPTTASRAHTLGSRYDPVNVRSHLWHALEGLDRYPNYLNRWSTDDIDKLEQALESQLKKVRDQKQHVLDLRRGIADVVNAVNQNKKVGPLAPQTWEDVKNNVLDPRMVSAIFRSKQFKSGPPNLQEVLNGQTPVELDAAMLEDIMDQEMFDVYSLPVLSSEFCAKLRNYIKEISEAGNTEELSHLKLGRRPTDLDTIGLAWVNDLLFHLVMRPISRHLFTASESMDELDWRHGYVAGYSVDPSSQTGTTRHRLVPHTDDSEVTMNLCIGDEFQGGALNFWGLRGTKDADSGRLVGEFQPRLGTALFHAGRHLHEVTQVTSGDRYAYIIWARSWQGSRAQTCPCCWLNRREADLCVCGPRWN